jgi:hypothetical protein
MKNLFRSLVAVWYLLGWVLHVYLGLFNPGVYQAFAETALIPGFGSFWEGVVMPHITVLALVLALFEVIVGGLLIYRKKWVTIGLVLSIGFNLFLVQLGLGFPAPDPGSDFYFNRFPNLVFVAVQGYLLFFRYPETVWKWIRGLKIAG